jgi:hypothetical protein
MCNLRNASIQWVLSPYNRFLKIWENPPGLQLAKWELPWECEGSFPHTLPHSREHEMQLSSFSLGPHPCKPLPWSKARVAIVRAIRTNINKGKFEDTCVNFVHMVEPVLINVIEGIWWQKTLHGEGVVYHENIKVTCFIFTRSSIWIAI